MISISVCMIIKNEEAVLDRILSQVTDFADEIIIADTGSTDRSKEIARLYTPYVFDFQWKQDFSAARNFACSKATMDYWMWLDADDVITPFQLEQLRNLKETLDPSIDVVMMKYVTGFDENGRAAFSYYRERLIKNMPQFYWQGNVHEAVTPSGNILYSPIEIEHRKLGPGDPHRNLRIYESMIKEGKTLEPRHQFYYARELYYHERYEDAIRGFKEFLTCADGWLENKIDACLQLSYCYGHLGLAEKQLAALFHSFVYDIPRAEICCAIGECLMNRRQYREAIFWYQQALTCPMNEESGGFVQKECYDFIPSIQLCVCYDRLGNLEKALEYHKKSRAIRPDAPAVQLNQRYFESLPERLSIASR